MKTYLLLRDNVESGPYTWESLMQMELRTFDLVWIPDESIVWKYPSEINELKQLTGYAPVTPATIINSLKERQIRFFREYIGEVDFRSLHLDEVNLPDAFINDIPVGFEFLVMADNYNKYGGNVYIGSEKMDDLNYTELQEEDTVATENELEKDDIEYVILGEKQKVDTAEIVADPNNFTTYYMHTRGQHKAYGSINGKSHRNAKSYKR